MALSKADRLTLQQLRLREWADRRRANADDVVDEPSSNLEGDNGGNGIPQAWKLTQGLDLHPWQEDAREAWFEAERRGTVKVVTGAGKTVVALAIVERLQELDADLRVAVVVPTIVLMNQWYDTILAHSNLPKRSLARLGGGHSDAFADETRVLIAVLASARKELPKLVDRELGRHLLLIADECHRVGAPEMSRVLETSRAYSLGLSATPERGEDEGDVGKQVALDLSRDGLGPIIYEMSFAEAIDLGVLPPFEIDHHGLPLTADEAQRYSALSKSIIDTRKELLAASPAARNAGGGERLVTWARRVSSRSGALAGLASRFVNDTTRRKQLLYRAESRTEATLALVREALESRADARVILFHESIDEVVRLFETLAAEGIPAVMEQSELPAELRETSLELFRGGIAQVVVSARSLIEGFNVPEADLGIIVASSSSPRQRIQSIGRVLRRYRGREGEEKASRVCVLYIRDTVDEAIYEREDWDKLIGLDRNRYFTWDPPTEPVERGSPPRAAIPTEREIDDTTLSFGDEWPGRYDGEEFSTDSQGNVVALDGRIATNPQDVPQRVASLKGQAGRFKVTPRRRVILALIPGRDGGWVTLFGGRLEEPFDFTAEAEPLVAVDVDSLAPGDPYPGPLEPAEELRFRQRRGGVIAKRLRNREVFASGDRAERLIHVLRDLSRTHGPISKFFVNERGHAFWRERGAALFIGAVNGRLTFPDDETG